MKAGDTKGARVALELLVSEASDRSETKELEAAIKLAEGDPDSAYVILSALIERQKNGEKNDQLLAFAESAHKTARFDEAAEAYDEVLTSGLFPAEDQSFALRGLADLNQDTQAIVAATLRMQMGEEGTNAAASGKILTKRKDGWRFGAAYERREFDIDGGQNGGRNDGNLIAESLGNRIASEVEVGYVAEHAYGRGQIATMRAGERRFVASATWNGAADDSFALTALNGREQRIDIGYYSNPAKRARLYAGAFGRRVEADPGTLGTGAGITWDAEWDLIGSNRTYSHGLRPQISIAYTGSWSTFDADKIDAAKWGFTASSSDAVDSLVERDYHSHGVELRASAASPMASTPPGESEATTASIPNPLSSARAPA